MNTNYFKVIDSEEKAYWLGFLYADGCVSISKNTYVVILELSNRDKTHIEKFKYALEAHQKIVEKKIM